MHTVPLGRTGLSVSKLGLGALFVKSENASLDEAKRAVARAGELGVSYLDTAPGYGDSEEVVGRCLAEAGGDWVVSTKLGGRGHGGRPFDPKDVDALVGSVETSLKHLGRERVDVLYVHEPDRPGQYGWWDDFATADGPVIEAGERLKDRGLVGHLGVGGTTTTEMAHLVRTGRFGVLLTAFHYNALFREAAEELLPAAGAAGTGVVLGSPLQQGLFTGRKPALVADDVWWLPAARKRQLAAFWDLCDEAGMSVPELAMRFAAGSPAVDTVLMGPKSVAEVEANVAAVEAGPLPADVLAKLDEIAALLPRRPYGEPVGLGWYANDPGGYNGQGNL